MANDDNDGRPKIPAKDALLDRLQTVKERQVRLAARRAKAKADPLQNLFDKMDSGGGSTIIQPRKG